MGATVATGSVRRRAQLGSLRPDLSFVELRGNIHTRLGKVPEGGAIVMAMAALEVLGIVDELSASTAVDPMSVDEMVPQVGQGAVAVECRADDAAARAGPRRHRRPGHSTGGGVRAGLPRRARFRLLLARRGPRRARSTAAASSSAPSWPGRAGRTKASTRAPPRRRPGGPWTPRSSLVGPSRPDRSRRPSDGRRAGRPAGGRHPRRGPGRAVAGAARRRGRRGDRGADDHRRRSRPTAARRCGPP